VRYEPGAIRAEGTHGGKKVSHELQTAGMAKKVELRCDRDELRADGRDLLHVETHVVDAKGVLVPEARHLVTYSVEGPGRIIGVDNGDVWSTESYQGDKRYTHQGRALAIVQSTGREGTVVVHASASGLHGGRVAARVEGRTSSGGDR
jgi:beta-galactosidase